MEWVLFLSYVIYEAIRVYKECKQNNQTFWQWCNTPLDSKDDYKMDA
ncbi:hypothetical protein [Pseudoalteromonas lipolytica]|uniref:Uncharacterized protein n=1 Tax=Pseudoalteromonas gelatinilytica TaxID=1703256 RepID=A0ABQ1T5R2_9GAMM|nr:hypothetical protein [Pseudoalteromonas lipolytica]GGE79838.1 hypothetical protein GCM10008027_00630 [Pseudoalteromonas profundi]